MNNLPREHHHLNAHARHLEKTLTALLWTLRFRWTATQVPDGHPNSPTFGHLNSPTLATAR